MLPVSSFHQERLCQPARCELGVLGIQLDQDRLATVSPGGNGRVPTSGEWVQYPTAGGNVQQRTRSLSMIAASPFCIRAYTLVLPPRHQISVSESGQPTNSARSRRSPHQRTSRRPRQIRPTFRSSGPLTTRRSSMKMRENSSGVGDGYSGRASRYGGEVMQASAAPDSISRRTSRQLPTWIVGSRSITSGSGRSFRRTTRLDARRSSPRRLP